MAKDLTKYQFNGNIYNKARLVLAVVAQYINDNPSITYQQLRQVFLAKNYNRTRDVIVNDENYQRTKSNSKDKQDRFFMSNGISLSDGNIVYVSNQWSIDRINQFIDHAKELGYSIMPKQGHNNQLEAIFQEYLKNPNQKWIDSYRVGHEQLRDEIENNPSEFTEDILSTIWREKANGVCSVGQGALSYKEFDSVKVELTKLLREIHENPSPQKFEQVMLWVKEKVSAQKFRHQKHAVVRRIFANISPENYTTVVDDGDLNTRINILNSEFGVDIDSSGNWAEVNKRLTRAVRQELSTDDPILINTFIWELPKFVSNQEEIAEEDEDYEMVLNPQNIILFGPPGTGKTYATTLHAVNLAMQADKSDLDRKDLVDLYQDLEAKKHICFTTFHQSFSYEDFIEGIKPVIDSDSDEVKYDIPNGIFKEVAERATKNYRLSMMEPENLQSVNYFHSLIQSFAENITDQLQTEPVKLTEKVSIVDVEENCFRYKGENWQSTHGSKVLFSELETSYHNNVKSRQELKKQDGISGLARQHATYQFYLLEMLREYEETFEYQKTKADSDDVVELDNYVIVIDEINRGNVSAIFGELITLIEPDKRLGMENETSVILPYSKEPFVVPPNLHILATMNTADRSVEALDSALRRRFVFLECPPEYDLLEPHNVLWRVSQSGTYCNLEWEDEEWKVVEESFFDLLGVDVIDKDLYKQASENSKKDDFEKALRFSGLNLARLLKAINQRIELLLDKDHQIGHSYFLNIEKSKEPFIALKEAFSNKIIPLLEEYFFGQPEKIGMVLGPTFVSLMEAQANISLFSDFDDDTPMYAEKKLYQITIPNNLDGFIAVYEK